MWVCEYCGAYLDAGERCDCEEQEKEEIERLWQILDEKRTACNGVQVSPTGN